WTIDGKAAEAGDTAHQGVDDGLHQRRCNGGVDRAAPGSQDVPPGLRRFGLRGYNHALVRHSILQISERTSLPIASRGQTTGDRPPSTLMAVPVMKEPCSEASRQARLANSSA